MKPLSGYLMSEDRRIATIENGEITSAEETLLPLYLKRTKDVEGWLASRAIDTHRANSRLLKKVLRLRTADDAETALSVNGATITDTYWICPANQPLNYADICFKENYFDGLALCGDPDSFSLRPSRTPELTNIGSYEKCWRQKDGVWWLYKAGTIQEYFSELFICRLGIAMDFSMAYYEMDGDYIRTRDFTEGAKVNFETADGFMGDDDDYSRCYDQLCEMGSDLRADYLKILWLDTLCFNMDRHTKNFGLLREKTTGRILKMAPNYDNNIALVSRGYSKDVTRSTDGLIRFFREFVDENPGTRKLLGEMVRSGEIPIVTEEMILRVLAETNAQLPAAGESKINQNYVREFVMNGQNQLLAMLE
ncbi:MAG: hypothetical protein MR303_01915 [Emergencia sp.]|nr:hypothetical protein [Emergencia sp.]